MKTEIVTTGSWVQVPDLVVFSEELVMAMEWAKILQGYSGYQ